MRKRKRIFVSVLIVISIIIIGLVVFVNQVINEITKVEPLAAPTLEQRELIDRVMETVDFDNMVLGRWISTSDSTIIEFGWARSFSILGDNDTYIYSIIKPTKDAYLIIRKMQCDTIFYTDSLTGGRNQQISNIQIEAFENRIINLSVDDMELASFMNESAAVHFKKME